ncbi:MAG: 2-oxoglutarate dehydrogenase E1 component, partial [Cytophagia bacterium]|nr:2-oxoglutarate dehydrogenase E1 component [Cytophagia bacterium]
NMVVANITTPANFFHALRRQMTWEFRKPLVVMSPKSLLRHPKAVSGLSDFTSGRFQEVIADDVVKPTSARKVVLCSGKVYYDLIEKREKDKIKDVAVIRLEQLHPFPKNQVDDLLAKYTKAEDFVWLQEEPENMGYWNYVQRIYPERSFKLISRKASASPATGFAKVHAEEQELIIEKAFA